MAVINLVSISLAPNPRTAAIYYFITALFVLLACFDTYFALPLNVSSFPFRVRNEPMVLKSILKISG